jgi:hypothetical protein
MGVVKRGWLLQRLFHNFMRRSRDFSGKDLSFRLIVGPPRFRGLLEKLCLEKRFLQEEGARSSLCAPGFCRMFWVFSFLSVKAKGDSFFKEVRPAVRKLFAGLNIEMSSLQLLSEFHSLDSSTSYPQAGGDPPFGAPLTCIMLYTHLSKSEASATNLPTSWCKPKGCSGRAPLQSRLKFILLV